MVRGNRIRKIETLFHVASTFQLFATVGGIYLRTVVFGEDETGRSDLEGSGYHTTSVHARLDLENGYIELISHHAIL
jgi:hypothetical protein